MIRRMKILSVLWITMVHGCPLHALAGPGPGIHRGSDGRVIYHDYTRICPRSILYMVKTLEIL